MTCSLRSRSPNALTTYPHTYPTYTMSSSKPAKEEKRDDIPSSACLEAAQRTKNDDRLDSSQPGMPIYHRRLANPAPLGLLSFATSVFLVSITGMGTRGVEAPNIIITTMVFFGGVCQYIAGIMEFVTGNTVSQSAPLTHSPLPTYLLQSLLFPLPRTLRPDIRHSLAK